MINPPPFPVSISELTESFLSDAVGEEVSEFKAERIGEDRGMLGEIFKLKISFRNESREPLILVAKFAALREETLDIAKRGHTHQRELRSYSELLSSAPVSVPQFIGSWYNDETSEFVLLQEMIVADTSVDQITGLSEKQARLVIAEMAKLHAFWWNDPKLETLSWLPRLDDERRRTNLTAITRNGWEHLAKLLDGEISLSSIDKTGEDLADQVDEMLCRTAKFPSTFIHSDLRADNLLFSLDGESVALIDWQGSCIAPPVFDFAYFLIQSLTIENRKRLEQDLIKFYAEELERSGLKISSDNLKEVYESSLFYSFAIACSIPLINDPGIPRVRELAIAMGTRSIQVLKDYGQI